jgi:hypothetical protein
MANNYVDYPIPAARALHGLQGHRPPGPLPLRGAGERGRGVRGAAISAGLTLPNTSSDVAVGTYEPGWAAACTAGASAPASRNRTKSQGAPALAKRPTAA